MNLELKKMMTELFEIMADPDLAKAIAKMMYGVFVELQAAGFTREEALQIVAKLNMVSGVK